MRKGGDLLQQAISDPCEGKAAEDGVLEGRWSSPASWAGQVRILVEPHRVGSQEAFCCSHLLDPPCQKLLQPHKAVWGEGGGVFVVRGCGIVGSQVLDEHVPSVGPEGLVGPPHEVWWRNIRSRWGGGRVVQGGSVCALFVGGG